MKIITRTMNKAQDFYALLQIARPNSILQTGRAELRVVSRCAGKTGNELHLESEEGETFIMPAKHAFQALEGRTVNLMLDPDPLVTVELPTQEDKAREFINHMSQDAYIAALKREYKRLHAERQNLSSVGRFIYEQIQLAEA